MLLPSVTVIVPTYNRPRQIEACMEAAAAIDYPADRLSFEIVDDGSDTPLTDAAFSGDCPFAVRITRQPNAGPAAARNRGASLAEGELLLFTDDDCRPHPGWVKAMAASHVETPTALIGGKVVNGLPDNHCSAASQDLIDFIYDYYRARGEELPFVTGNNIGCARSAFRQIGGFDASFDRAAGEDREFFLRWKRSGRPVVFNDAACIDHFHALRFKTYMRQHFNYGRGARQLHRSLKVAGEDGAPVEGARFYGEMLLSPLRKQRPRPIYASMLMAMSQAAMVGGYVAALASSGRARER